MTTAIVNYSPPIGKSFVTLTGVTGITDYGFTATPAATHQIVFSDSVLVDASGVSSQTTGTENYTLITETGAQETKALTLTASDTTPDVFSFTPANNATATTQYTSNTVTITGINEATAISITAGEYSINSGAYTSVSGTVNNNDTVTVRLTTGASGAATATLDVGGVTANFVVTIPTSGSVTTTVQFLPPLAHSVVDLVAPIDPKINDLLTAAGATANQLAAEGGQVLVADANGSFDANFNYQGSVESVFPFWIIGTDGQICGHDVDATQITEYNATPTPDTVAPVLTLNGLATQSHTQGSDYTDLGASWTDNVDGSGTVLATTPLNVNTLGAQVLSYQYTDAAVNASNVVTRTVTVVAAGTPDTTKPVIALNGSSTVNITVGNAYTEQGATWTDNVDGSGAVTNITGAANTSIASTYTVRYNFTDAAGNAADEVTRTVIVSNAADTTKPVITITAGTDTVNVGDTWIDAGATWADNVDGSGAVTDVTSSVNTAVAGVYPVQYNHADVAGNVADTATRTVTVQAVMSGTDPAIYKDVHFEGSLSKHVDMGEIEAYQGDTLRLSGSILDNDGNALTTGNLVIKMFNQTHIVSLTGHLFVDVPDNAFANNVVTVTADAPDMDGKKAQVRVSSLTIAIQD